jgi:FAD/FMN-containing dehydrogenase
VTKKVAPDVPSGAFMPSTHQALAQARFTVPGSNIGCDLTAGGVRCNIQQRGWTAPPQPSSCNATWGNAIAMQATGAPAFACGGASAISSDAKVVPDGWDDKVGKITCQVRSFSVDCFSAGRHGFIISRTGYAFY